MKIRNLLPGSIGVYAEQELREHLSAVCGKLPPCTFLLQTDPKLPEYAYGYSVSGDTVTLSGRREHEVLLAVYLLLERLGFTFDTDTRYPQRLDVSALKESELIRPFVRLRGIRQHINFLMDISSYHLKDAKAYIRSLARMRMNAITFHSYDGMWHHDPGHFFYGKTHPLPKQRSLREKIDNRSYYMIPACEALYGDEKAVGEYAVYFLNELIQTAKQCGMHVTLSIEPSEDLSVTAEALAFYPDIDMLELITPEGGGVFKPTCTDTASIKAHAVKLFGEEILEHGILPGLDEQLSTHSEAIVPTFYSLNRAMTHAQQVDTLPVRVGLYVLCPETLYIVKRIMDKVLPTDMIKTFLPAHGAEAVKDVVKGMEFAPEDFQHTVLHSWIEFDGNMYLSQNAANAIDRTCRLLQEHTKAPSIHAMYFNHWRTEENRISIAYAAAATEAPIPVDDWYLAYAKRMGIPDVETFAALMTEAGELDIFCRDKLFNIGFCFLSCWTAHFGNGWIKEFTPEKLSAAKHKMQTLIEGFDTLLAQTNDREGIFLLRFLQNRYAASILHLDAIGAMNRLFTEGESALEEALTYAAAYLQTYSQMLPDRGGEGQLVDYAQAMPGYVAHLRSCYFGAKAAAETQSQKVAPPPAPV